MENVCDDVLYSILGRLPGKPLLRLRCVSNRWNALISDPYFMKSRSRRMILLPYTRPLVAIDEKVPVKDKAHSMVGIHYPLEKSMVVSIVGTFNGIVLLALTDFYKSLRCELVLYNPLTCASNKLLVMDPLYQTSFVFGFADLKIVRFEVFNDSMYRCDAFDLKTSSWSSRPLYLIRDFRFGGDAGMFLNGFLYWDTFKPLDGLTTGQYFKPTPSVYFFKDIRAIEYVEGLVLPSHISTF